MNTLRCFNSFEQLAEFQQKQDLDKQKQREEWALANPYIKDPLAENPILPSPFNKIYDHGEGIDVPLEELIETAKKELETRSKEKRHIDRINNIRIYQDDYENGNYDVKFYGRSLPLLIKQVQKRIPRGSSIKTYEDICHFLDSSDYYVGRSEDNIIERLSSIPVKEKAYYRPPSWRFLRRYLKELDNIFTEQKDTTNRQAARAAAMKCLNRLAKVTQDNNLNDSGIKQGFDLAARLGDYLGYDMVPLFSNLGYGITRRDNVCGHYSPQNHTLCINPKYVGGTKEMCATIFHELFHAIDARLDVESIMENEIPKDPELTQSLQEYLDETDSKDGISMVRRTDPVRLAVPSILDQIRGRVDEYSAERYLIKRKNGEGQVYKDMSEYITELLSDYIEKPERINKNWLKQVLKAFLVQKERNGVTTLNK